MLFTFLFIITDRLSINDHCTHKTNNLHIQNEIDLDEIRKNINPIFLRIIKENSSTPSNALWKNLSKLFPQVNFVTVDCSTNNDICSQYTKYDKYTLFTFIPPKEFDNDKPKIYNENEFNASIIDIISNITDFYPLTKPANILDHSNSDSFFENNNNPIFVLYNSFCDEHLSFIQTWLKAAHKNLLNDKHIGFLDCSKNISECLRWSKSSTLTSPIAILYTDTKDEYKYLGQYSSDTKKIIENFVNHSQINSQKDLQLLSDMDNETLQNNCGKNLTFVVENDTIIVSGFGEMSNTIDWHTNKDEITTVIIGENATKIGSNAFQDFSLLETVHLPKTLTYIDELAFAYCKKLCKINISNIKHISYNAFRCCESLTSLEFHRGVEILGSAFYGCSSITSITFRNDSYIRTLSTSSFGNCSNLERVFIPASVEKMGGGVFQSCSKLTSLEIDPKNKNFKVENGMLLSKNGSILYYYPCSCQNTSYIIPYEIMKVMKYAFSSHWLKKLIFHGGIANLNIEMFVLCTNLEYVNVTSNYYYSSEDGVLFSKNKDTLVAYPPAKKNSKYIVPSRVDIIESNAFKNNYYLETLITYKLTMIKTNAFFRCLNLSTFLYISGVELEKRISAFYQCPKLEFVYTYATYSVPYFCNLPAKAVFRSGHCGRNISFYMFTNNHTLFLIGQGNMDDYYRLSQSGSQAPWYNYRDAIYFISMDDSITSIGIQAFSECYNLLSISISKNVTTINRDAFKNCYSMKSIDLPPSLKTIQSNAFSECRNMTSIIFPPSLEYIGKGSFYQCYNLKNIEFSQNITYIDDLAFSNCSIESLYFPKNLEYVGNLSFSECYHLSYVFINEKLNYLSNMTFFKSIMIEKFEVDEKSPYFTSIDGAIFTKNQTTLYYIPYLMKKTTYVIPYWVTHIGDNVFNSNKKLTKIEISPNVTFIGNMCFAHTIITSINIYGNLKNVGYQTFCNSSLIYVYYFGSTNPECDRSSFVPRRKKIDIYVSMNYSYSLVGYEHPIKALDWGKCGDNIMYLRNNETKKIELIGFGMMYNYSYYEDVPWYLNILLIENVIVDGRITSFGNYSFYNGIYIKSINIHSNISYIGDYAFYKCTSMQLTTINRKLTYINGSSFCGVRSTGYRVENGNANYLSIDGVVYSKDKKTLICYPKEKSGDSFTIPSHVTTIGDFAFSYAAFIRTMTINDTVKTVGIHSFSFIYRLLNITCDSETIGDYAFYYDSYLENITLSENLHTIGDYAFAHNKIKKIHFPLSIKSIGNMAFSNNTLLSSAFYYISNPPQRGYNIFQFSKITTIFVHINYTDDYFGNISALKCLAFGECGPDLKWLANTHLNNLTIYGSGYMDNYSFSFKPPWYFLRDNITKVGLNDDVLSLGDFAFLGFNKMISINIPERLRLIGNGVFVQCPNLVTISVSLMNPYYKKNEYYLLSSDKKYFICSPAGTNDVDIIVDYKVIKSYAYDSNTIKKIRIGPKVELIEENAFSNCNCLSKIDTYSNNNYFFAFQNVLYNKNTTEIIFVPSKITGDIKLSWDLILIKNNTFANCELLTSVEFPQNMVSIGDYAFSNCTKLKTLELNSFLTSIGDYAFSNCQSLESLSLKRRVNSIGDYAFSNCTSLKSLVLNENLSSIGNYAFANCESLEMLILEKEIKLIGNHAFSHCISLKSVNYTGLYDPKHGINVFYGCVNLSFINVIPEYLNETCCGMQIYKDSIIIISSIFDENYSSINSESSEESNNEDLLSSEESIEENSSQNKELSTEFNQIATTESIQSLENSDSYQNWESSIDSNRYQNSIVDSNQNMESSIDTNQYQNSVDDSNQYQNTESSIDSNQYQNSIDDSNQNMESSIDTKQYQNSIDDSNQYQNTESSIDSNQYQNSIDDLNQNTESSNDSNQNQDSSNNSNHSETYIPSIEITTDVQASIQDNNTASSIPNISKSQDPNPIMTTSDDDHIITDTPVLNITTAPLSEVLIVIDVKENINEKELDDELQKNYKDLSGDDSIKKIIVINATKFSFNSDLMRNQYIQPKEGNSEIEFTGGNLNLILPKTGKVTVSIEKDDSNFSINGEGELEIVRHKSQSSSLSINSTSKINGSVKITVQDKLESITIDSIELSNKGSLYVGKAEKENGIDFNVRKVSVIPDTNAFFYNVNILNSLRIAQTATMNLNNVSLEKADINLDIVNYGNIKDGWKIPFLEGTFTNNPKNIFLNKLSNGNPFLNTEFTIVSGVFKENLCTKWLNSINYLSSGFNSKVCNDFNPLLSMENKQIIVKWTSFDDKNKKLNGGQIAGIIIGCIAGVCIIILAVLFIIKKRNKEQKSDDENPNVELSSEI